MIYGPVERIDECAVTIFLPQILENKEMKVSHNEYRYPCHVLDISRTLCDLIAAKQKVRLVII